MQLHKKLLIDREENNSLGVWFFLYSSSLSWSDAGLDSDWASKSGDRDRRGDLHEGRLGKSIEENSSRRKHCCYEAEGELYPPEAVPSISFFLSLDDKTLRN